MRLTLCGEPAARLRCTPSVDGKSRCRWSVIRCCARGSPRSCGGSLEYDDGEAVKDSEPNESARAAEVLGAKLILFDVGDYLDAVEDKVLFELTGLFAEFARNPSLPFC